MSIEDGKYIIIEFDQPLQGNLAENLAAFAVFAPVYAMDSDWAPVTTQLPITDIRWYEEGRTDKLLIELGSGNKDTMQVAAGPVLVRYAAGKFRGEKGPLLSFARYFTPSGVAYKGDQNAAEHVQMLSCYMACTLTDIRMLDASAPGEHVAMVGASLEYSLTNVEEV